MPSPVTRILSDLHYGHKSSLVWDWRQIAPLVEGAGRVVFNGDTVEMRFREERPKAVADAEALRELCLEWGAQPILLTGNHDPALTDLHHLELAGGAVLVTHGDILFHGLSPWSVEAARLIDAHTRELAAMGNPVDFPSKLLAMRRAALALEGLGEELRRHQKPGLLFAIKHHLWPPWRPLRIVAAWMRTPALADALAAYCLPRAQFVALGHTHYSGVWRRGQRIVINTGGFLPLAGRLAIDLDDETLTVREIISDRGLFRFGREIGRFPVNPGARE